jgi:hypothetical protein
LSWRRASLRGIGQDRNRVLRKLQGGQPLPVRSSAVEDAQSTGTTGLEPSSILRATRHFASENVEPPPDHEISINTELIFQYLYGVGIYIQKLSGKSTTSLTSGTRRSVFEERPCRPTRDLHSGSLLVVFDGCHGGSSGCECSPNAIGFFPEWNGQ